MYPLLNKTMRESHSDSGELGAFLPYLKLLLTALNKLPLVRLNVYRVVNVDVHNEYNQLEGKVFRWWAFSSTTSREGQRDNFLAEKSEHTLFNIDVIGVDIAAFSAFPHEDEVLMLPGTCLVVDPGVMVEPNYWKFEASVWKAVHPRHRLQRDEAEHENEEVTNSCNKRDDDAESTTIFQNTDLAHPGWKTIV